jgi:urease accessory protein
MLCDRVLGRYDGGTGPPDPVVAGRLDWLDLTWDECHRRALRKNTRQGRAVRLLLRLGVRLRHGDVVADAADCLLVVDVRPVEVLVARPRSAREAAVVAVEWGNLHVPVQVADHDLATLPDGPAEAVLHEHDVPFAVERRRFEPMPVSGLTWTLPASAARRGPVREIVGGRLGTP